MLKLKKIKVSESNVERVDSPVPFAFPPSFHADDYQIVEIGKLDVGKKYRFTIEVEMKSKEEREKGIDGRFDITAYKYIPKKSMDDMSDEEFGEFQGEELSKR